MNAFRNFMIGRYGNDALNLALLVLTALLMLLLRLIAIPYLELFAYIPLGFCIYRTFSKKIYNRRQENLRFIGYVNPIKKRFVQIKMRAQDYKTHKYFKCPACGILTRVPKGKGKVCITCPKCKQEFVKKT